MQKLYIGKFTKSDQYDGNFYLVDNEQDISWFNGIIEGDLVLPSHNGYLGKLLKLKSFEKRDGGIKAIFDEIKKFSPDLELTKDIICCKYFSPDINLLNKIIKSTNRYGFHRITLEDGCPSIDTIDFENSKRRFLVILEEKKIDANFFKASDICVVVNNLEDTKINDILEYDGSGWHRQNTLWDLYQKKNGDGNQIYSLSQLLELAGGEFDGAKNKEKYLKNILAALAIDKYFVAENAVSVYDNILVGRKKVNNAKETQEDVNNSADGGNSVNVWIEKTSLHADRSYRTSGEYAFGASLWSPQKDKSGKDIYKHMREVKTGDYIIHINKDKHVMSGISKTAQEFEVRNINVGSEWDGEDYFIKTVEYKEFKVPISISDILNKTNEKKLNSISAIKRPVFYDKSLNLSQGGYLTYCIPELFELINEIHHDKTGQNIPYFNDIAAIGGQTGAVVPTAIFDKNIILYGPPGTGKTYKTVIFAVAIIEKKTYENVDEEAKSDYSLVLERYNRYKKAKQIAFTTFHQSYGYEEFIEGIKPRMDEDDNSLGFEKADGVFKEFCSQAGSSIIESAPVDINENATIWKITLKDGNMNDIKKDCFKNARIRIDWDSAEDLSDNGKRCMSAIEEEMQEGDIVLSLKNLRTIDGIGVINSEGYTYDGSLPEYKPCRGVKWLATEISEDIYAINGNHFMSRPTIVKLKRMKVADVIEIVKKYNETFSTTQIKKNDANYVFIIDEINRGNISKIFGELITLIEDTKRTGAKEAATAKLPYTGDEFGVPDNVYIVGTMNSADRSIALMDTALRRRFRFYEMMPKSEVLKDLGIITIAGIDVVKMLDTINERIELLFDREHTIGHAYFTPLKENPSLSKMSSIFQKSIIPLLQEYFYEDYHKIQLVLGDNTKSDNKYKFVLDSKVEVNSVFKGILTEIDVPETKYVLQPFAFDEAQSYIEIY